MNVTKKILKHPVWEYFIPALAVISLLVSCIIISSKKFFWNDELLSFYLLNDPSLIHMLVAWSDKFNQAPPFYFILGWIWDKIFGSTELSLRLFSSVTMGLACLVVWTVLRRTYDFWATTVGTLSVFCLSELVQYHNAELRMYGLFTVVCAFGLLQYDSINRKEKIYTRDLFINLLIHCAILLTHLYGLFYSLAILAAFAVRDKHLGFFRKNIYCSVLAAWGILIPLAPLIINQSNNSAKWFTRFKLSAALDLLTPFSRLNWFILILLIIAAFLKILGSTNNGKLLLEKPSSLSKKNSEDLLLIFAIFFMLVPLATWIITVTLKPLLNDRYILPTITLSWSILLTYSISQILPDFQALICTKILGRSLNLRSLILSILTLALLLYPIYYAEKFSLYSQKPGANDSSYGYFELPIVLEAGHDFLPRFHYSPKPSRYFHILDWETATKNVGSAFATGDYVHLNAISKHYPFIQSIQSKDFLERYNRFLVLDERDQKWFESRVEHNPNYQIQELGTEQGAFSPLTMYLVERLK